MKPLRKYLIPLLEKERRSTLTELERDVLRLLEEAYPEEVSAFVGDAEQRTRDGAGAVA